MVLFDAPVQAEWKSALETAGATIRAYLPDNALLFVDECPGWMRDLDAAIDEGDAAEAKRAAHTLKGSADHWGARQTFDLALRMERLCRDGKLDEARQLRAELARSVDDLLPLIQAFAKSNEHPSRPGA